MPSNIVQPLQWYDYNRDYPLSEGLAGYWPMWGGHGAGIAELVGATGRPTGTAVGTSWATGPNGTAIDFGAIADSFRIENPFTPLLDMGGATEGTWSVWINVRSVDGTADSRFFDHHGATAANSWGWAFGLEGTGAGRPGTELALYINATVGDWDMISAPGVLITGEWHLYIVTWRGGDFCRFYRDGKFIAASATGVAAGPIATVAGDAGERIIYIGGRDPDDAARNLDGLMGEAAVWNRVLEDAEIESLFDEQFRIITPGPIQLGDTAVAAVGNPWYYYAQQAAVAG